MDSNATSHIASFLSGNTQTAYAATKTDEKDKKAEDKGKPVLLHPDPHVRKAVSHSLKAAHKHAFGPDVKTLDDAKNKHAAIVALADDGDDDENNGKDKKKQ